MKKDIYGGVNPIFESLKNSMNEENKSSKKEAKAIDTISAVVTSLNTMFSLLLSSKLEDGKTVRGFESIKEKILGTENFGSFRQYIISFIDSLSKLDNKQKSSYDSNIAMISSLLSGNVETTLSDPKIFKSLKNDTLIKLLSNFTEDLKQREEQIRKTNPKLLSYATKNGLIVKESEISEERRSGDETDVSDAEFRGLAFNKSKESLDASNAFVGMIDRDKYVPILKDNADVRRFKDIADNLYKKAQDLQMLDRSGALGGKIVTPSGEFKAREYKRKQDDLLNDIIRQKKEYERLKNSLLKDQGVVTPVESEPVCPAGQYYDKSLGKCVDLAKSTDSTDTETVPVKKKKKIIPVPVKTCDFPISIGNNMKCTQVGDVQDRLIALLPSVAKYLKKFGGADKMYGEGTAAVCNVVYGYIMGDNKRSLRSDLTKEMYSAIMDLGEPNIDKTTIIIKEGLSGYFEEMSIDDKIQEREEISRVPVLSFEDFYSIIEETYSFTRMDEEDAVSGTIPNNQDKQVQPGKKLVRIYDNCVEKSLAKSQILDCVSATGPEPSPTGPTGPTGDKPVWKGLKPVNDGAYTVYYDESWGQWFGDFSKGVLISGIIVGVTVATMGAAGVAIPVAGTLIGASSMGAAGLAGAGAAAAGLVTTGAGAGVLTAGAIGGGAIIKWAGNDRKPATILVYAGYIEDRAVRAMARGIYNSLTGTVASPDILAIYSTLILCRGTYTDNGEGKAVSVWSEVKKFYSKYGGGNLESDIRNITAGGVGGFFKDIVTDMDTIPSFPTSFKTKDPLKGAPAEFEEAKDACDLALDKLTANENKLRSNLKNITEEDLEKLSEGMEEITPQIAAKLGKSSKSEDSED